MMEAVSVTEELEAHPLINNMKEREKNNFKNPRLLRVYLKTQKRPKKC